MKRIGLQDPVLTQVLDLAEEALAPFPYAAFFLEWVQQGSHKILRVYIEKKVEPKNAIKVKDCAQVSQILEMAFETKNLISEAYTLEVSSPGLNRPLVRPEDFKQNLGRSVRLETLKPLSGRKKFKGNMKESSEETIEIDIEGEVFCVPFKEIKKARLDYFASPQTQNKTD